MEKRKNIFCAWVRGQEQDLDRGVLREEFSKFGNVLKIYIDAEVTFAKVYLDDFEKLKQASNHLNGVRSWKIKVGPDTYNKHDSVITSANSPNSRISLNQSFGASSNGNMHNMEEDYCIYAGDYVDVHGREVEVVQAENGVLYVNLDDVRTAGYNIYKKESFANATISKEIDLRHLENFLLNQARKYVLNEKKRFSEDEMLGIFERVEAKLQSKPVGGSFGQGRVINTSPNTKNISITLPSNSPAPAASNRPPKQLDANFQPSFSHTHQRPKNDPRQNQQNVPRQNQQNVPDGTKRWNENRNDTNENKRKPAEKNMDFTEVNQKPAEKNMGFTEVNQSDMRRPRQNLKDVEAVKNFPTRPLANSSANEEVTEAWEDTTSPAQKSKPHNDSSSEGRNLNIDRISLAPNGLYKIKVSYIKPDKKSLFYAQSLDNINQVEEILLHVNTEDLKLPEITAPAREMLCVAYFEDCWYRAVVLHPKQIGGVFVELIDYGNKEIIKTPLREMSPEMKKIPGMAIRVAVHQGSDDTILSTDQELEVFVKKHYDDLCHLVEIKRFLDGPKLDRESPTPPSDVSSDHESQKTSKVADKPVQSVTEDCFMEINASPTKLTNGESVMIISYGETQFILRNKDTAKICKDLYTHLSTMEKKPIANPKVGQLVLCSRDGIEGLHRAVIKKINDSVADLEYLDYYGGDTLSLNSLRNVDKFLAEAPISTIESPAVDWLQKLSDISDLFLTKLVMNKVKLKVVLEGPKFDLLLPEGDTAILLSKKIEQLENRMEVPKPKVHVRQSSPTTSKSTEAPVATPVIEKEKTADDDQYVKISYDNMPFVKVKMGENDYICYNCKEGSVTLVCSEDAEKYIEQLVVVETSDTVPYEPEEYEMCLGKFDETWYRAVPMDIKGDTYEVFFVDFGNTETLSKKDIRRFPKDLAEIPILGIGAYFTGIPDNPKVHNRLKELIQDETVMTVNVKEDLNDQLKCGIEVPSVYKILKTENLI